MRNRLHALCPYFAMFPETFVKRHVKALTEPGDWVFDPFSGRGTTLLQSLLLKRQAAAVDVNPVAFCISGAKAHPPNLTLLLEEIGKVAARYDSSREAFTRIEDFQLPPFFGRGFYHETLRQLVYLRRTLRWRTNQLHRFIAALVLGVLHGEMDRSRRYLSNQMPRTISSKPTYSLEYWRERDLWARKRDVFARLYEDAILRLHKPPTITGIVRLGDARRSSVILPSLRKQITAVITSPPYFNVTNFEEDQWLRLWFLGHHPHPTYRKISKDDRHEKKDLYWRFLSEAWQGMAELMKPESYLVCRLGGIGLAKKEITNGLLSSVRESFPHAKLLRKPRKSTLRRRQTEHFRPDSIGCRFEVDYIVALGKKRV